jgi:PAS domain S-box-containing protein
MAIGCSTFYILISMEYTRIHKELVHFAMIRDSFFKLQLEMNISELEGLQHFCNIYDNVNCDRFDRFTQIILSQYKDIRTLEWIPCIRNADRNRFINDVRKKGMEDFDIREYDKNGELVRAKSRDIYYPVFHMKSKDETEHIPGYDLGTSPDILATMEKARDTGKKMATKEVRVLHGMHTHNLFMMIMPVYKNGNTPDTIHERRKNIRGFVLGSFCIRAMSEAVVEKARPAGINIFVFDQTEPLSSLLFTHISRLEKNRSTPDNLTPKDIYDPLQYISTIEVGGRHWCFIYTPYSHYIYDHISWWPFSILLVELIIAAWILIYVINNRNQTAFIQQKINEAEGSLRKFKKAVEEAGHAIYITDKNGIFEYVNPAFLKVTGYDLVSIIGKSTNILKSNKMNNEYYQNLWNTLLKGEIWCEEIINTRRDGKIYTALQTISPIINESGMIENFVAIQIDITRQKEIEIVLKNAQLKAETANRAKSIFLANMSHEIRTPMNAVIGFSDLLYAIVTDKTQRSYIESIRSAGKNLLQIINDILDLSKIEAGKMQIQLVPVNPHAIFDEIKKMFMLKKKEQIDIIMEIDQEIPKFLMLDEIRFIQILINVVGNALKFTEKGYIRIKAEKLCTNYNDYIDLLIAIEDTGIGIEQDQLEVVFESFKQQDSQSTKKYGGTGLGLSITRHLLQLMDGEINVKSEIGKGSLFEIKLRNIEIQTEHSESLVSKNVPNFDHYHFENSTILIVDDISSNRILLKESLMKTKATILEATNGQEGFDMAKQHIPDLILMDIKMPVMDGYESLMHIRKDFKTKHIPVIALTAGSSGDNKEELKQFNSSHIKPINIKYLFDELCHYLKSDQTMSDINQGTDKALCGKVHDTQVVGSKIIQPETLIQQIKKNMMPQWKSLKGAIDIDEIAIFAQELICLANTHHAVQLNHYADQLLEYAQNFEIEKIEETLALFPTRFKEILKNI